MTAHEVQAILHRIGLRPQQAAGQNFLLDESVVASMVDASGLEEGQKVLEIGPGLGILTKTLLDRGMDVLAVELDQRLYAYLRTHFRGEKGLTLINNDIFKVRLDTELSDGEYSLVSNLPYSGTSLIFRNFLTLTPRPKSMTVMIQKDVAKRIVAEPGDMSTLSLMVQRYARPEILFDVPPMSFFPVPKVVSSVLYADTILKREPKHDVELFRYIRAGFSSKRKLLRNNLHNSLGISLNTLDQRFAVLNIDEKARAQELTLDNWLGLAKKEVDY